MPSDSDDDDDGIQGTDKDVTNCSTSSGDNGNFAELGASNSRTTNM
jgi:hypothetical protein